MRDTPTQGRLIAIVGPSGVGKDTVIDAVCAARPDIVRARRVITRPSEAGGEDFDGVDRTEFARRMDAGDFALNWEAHGLFYGVPLRIEDDMAAGRQVIFNGSRAVLPAAKQRYPDMVVILLTADPDTLAGRLADRGRETAQDIRDRLARARMDLPAGLNPVEICNDGPLDQTVARVLAVIDGVQPESV